MFWVIIFPISLLALVLFLVWFLGGFFEPGKRNQRNKKLLNKLELNVSSEELIKKLDSLEQISIRLEQRQGNEEILLIFGNNEKLWINNTEIDTSTTPSYDSLKLISKDVATLSKKEFDFFLDIDKVMRSNKITAINFAKNYKENDITRFYYRVDLCDNSYWCEREIVFSKH